MSEELQKEQKKGSDQNDNQSNAAAMENDSGVGKWLLLNFLISFVTGMLTAALVLFIYTSFVYRYPHFYSFDLAGVIKKQELAIMHSPDKKNMKAEIDKYIRHIKEYIDGYAKNGIVLVSGASIGDSPYVKDITKGFYEKHGAGSKK